MLGEGFDLSGQGLQRLRSSGGLRTTKGNESPASTRAIHARSEVEEIHDYALGCLLSETPIWGS